MDNFNLLPLMYGEEPNVFTPSGIISAANLPVSGITIQQQKKSPIPDDLYKKLTERQLQSFKDQAAGVKEFEGSIQDPKNIDPVLAVASGLSDFFSGTNYLQGLSGQKAAQEKQAREDKFKLQQMKQNLTDKEIDMLKNQFQYQQESDQLKAQMGLAREKIAAEREKSGKTLSASEAEQLADIKDQLNSTSQLFSDWEEKVGGITEGLSGGFDYLSKKTEGLLPNTSISEYKRNLEQKAQMIGKALEGGKLTDVDFEKYIKFLPQPGDTAEMAKSRIRNLEEALKTKYRQRVKTFGEAGYNVGGISPVEQLATPIKKSAPSEGETKEWDGKIYKKQGDRWVEVK